MANSTVDRRRFLVGLAAAGTVGAAAAATRRADSASQTINGGAPWQEGMADAPTGAAGTGYAYFTGAEAAFIEAAVERLIPGDPVGPGAVEAGVPVFIDRQLAGPYGRGDHYFLGGPWPKGTPEQGYQTRFTPAQLYRAAIPAIERHVGDNHGGRSFATLAAGDQDGVLKALEGGKAALGGGVDAKTFFTMLLQNTKEGYFADPIYGGNRAMGAWKMIGFPGAHYDYREWVTRHGEKVPYEPVGLKGRPGWREG